MSNIIQVTNNVTKNTVEVQPGGSSTQLDVTNATTQTTLEFNSGLFLAAPVATLGDLSDVVVPSPGVTDSLIWGGSSWTSVSPTTFATFFSLTDIADVTAGATSGQVLRWDGVNSWDPDTLTLQDITDGGTTTTDSITTGGLSTSGTVSATGGVTSGTWTLPTANGSAGQVLTDAGFVTFDLGDLDDVVDSSAIGDFLWKTPLGWRTTTPEISMNSDVNSSTEAVGDILRWNGSMFVNAPLDDYTSLDAVTTVGSTTSNTIGVGNVTINGAWSFPTTDADDDTKFLRSNADGTSEWDYVSVNQADDVYLNVLSNGEYLQWNGVESRWENTVISIDDLNEVDTSGATNGQYLVFNGTQWLPSTLTLEESISLTDLDDVDTTGVGVGDVITFNGTTWDAQPVPGVSTIYMDDLGDADMTTTPPVADDFLKWDGSNWVPAEVPPAELSADINVTDAAGNYSPGDVIPAGTSFETVFNNMMVSYQVPVLTLSGWTTGTYEHGATFNDTSYTLAFTNDSNIDVGVNGTWTTSDTYITGDTGSVAAADGSYSTTAFSGQLLVANTSVGTGAYQRTGAAALTVNGFQDTNTDAINSQTKSSTVRFRYWIVDSATALTIDTFTDLEGNNMMTAADPSLNGGGAGVVESGLMSGISNLGDTFAGGHDYIYWVYPAYFTVSSVVLNGSTNLYAGDEADKTTAVIHMGTFDMTNQFGETVTMDVLRTKVSNALAGGSVITVS